MLQDDYANVTTNDCLKYIWLDDMAFWPLLSEGEILYFIMRRLLHTRTKFRIPFIHMIICVINDRRNETVVTVWRVLLWRLQFFLKHCIFLILYETYLLPIRDCFFLLHFSLKYVIRFLKQSLLLVVDSSVYELYRQKEWCVSPQESTRKKARSLFISFDSVKSSLVNPRELLITNSIHPSISKDDHALRFTFD